MLPYFTANNLTYMTNSQTVHGCKLRSRDAAESELADIQNCTICQKGFVVGFAGWCPAFFSFVALIIGRSPQKKMAWVDASRIVAFVANVQS
jgi:hypothetical protein